MLMLSALNLWSMGRGKGAPSFYRTVTGYLDAGWAVTLIMPKDSPENFIQVKNLNIIEYRNGLFLKLFGIKKVGFVARLIYAWYCTFLFYYLGIKEGRDADIIYAYEVNAVKAGKMLSQSFKVPLVTRFQGTILSQHKNTYINRLRFYPHYHALKTPADITIMTDDGSLGDKVLEKLGNKSTYRFFWKNGVNIDYQSLTDDNSDGVRKQHGISSDEKILLTVSRLVGWKRVDRAIIAMKCITESYPKCKLVIVGDGPERENLEKLSNELGLHDDVIFTGSVSHDKVSTYMYAADVFLSLYDISNVGNPLLEAMLIGKAIVTLNVGDTKNLISHEKTGLLLSLEEIDKLPQKVIDLLRNPSKTSKLGENAREFALQHFWTWEERIKREIIEVEKLLL